MTHLMSNNSTGDRRTYNPRDGCKSVGDAHKETSMLKFTNNSQGYNAMATKLRVGILGAHLFCNPEFPLERSARLLRPTLQTFEGLGCL